MNFYNIKVKAKTWVRDSYGLFDYETKDIVRNQLMIEKAGVISREGNEVRFLEEVKEEDSKAGNRLISFNEDNGACFVEEIKETELWMALSSKLDKGKTCYFLKEGDELKMGRIQFKVLQVNKEEKFEPTYRSVMSSLLMENFEQCPKNKLSSEPSDFTDELLQERRICRICLSNTHEEENPLLDPCHCSGTMKFVHYFCLQTWLIKRLNLEKNKGVISILWQSLVCELCHSAYPLTMEYRERTYDLINFFENPEYLNNDDGIGNNSTFINKARNSILLKSFTKEGVPNGLHLIEFSTANNNEISIGRGNDCHIRVNDISVSRQHARLFLDNYKIVLQDNSSKFGTLIKINKKDLIADDRYLYLQVGRTSFEVQISKKWNIFGICLNCSEKAGAYLKEKKG